MKVTVSAVKTKMMIVMILMMAAAVAASWKGPLNLFVVKTEAAQDLIGTVICKKCVY